MELTFWGVRGIVPVSGKETIKFGGHTSCASVLSSKGEMIIIDAGTGIKMLGDHLMNEKKDQSLRIHILFTHFHLDHIMGLPFFAPLYSPEAVITFYASSLPKETEGYLKRLMAGRYFPLELNETHSIKEFKKIPQENFIIGGIQVSHHLLNHPQSSIAFKLQEEQSDIVFATDTEHPEKGIDEGLASFAYAADFLIYDATYTPEEYNSGKRGWGHSTWLEGVKLARKAKVRELCLSHFNPNYSDNKIDRIISLARKEFNSTEGAMEGLKKIFRSE